ncbi:MAG: hypothetical protein AAFN81_10065, partial [Bacteroidota bacterium]
MELKKDASLVEFLIFTVDEYLKLFSLFLQFVRGGEKYFYMPLRTAPISSCGVAIDAMSKTRLQDEYNHV